MLAKSIVIALLSVAAVSEASVIHKPFGAITERRARGLEARAGTGSGGNTNAAKASTGAKTNAGTNNAAASNTGNNNAASSNTCLSANVIQKGSQSTGQVNNVAADGQANSATDNANFINFCQGKTLTNGAQVKAGSCNGIVMGEIPASTKMVSAMLQNPAHNDNLQANKDFDVTVQMANLQAGSFTNATSTYYSAPQALNSQGLIVGHTHVTIQDMGNSLTPSQPLDASKFVFFKGIDDAGSNGLLTATVTGGLPAGNYRVCTMTAASNHQPVLMPVAQRGAQDDCNKFTVGGSGNTNNAATGNTSNKGSSAASSAASASASAGSGNTGKGNKGGNNAAAASTTSSAASAATSAATSGNTGKGSKGGNAAGSKAAQGAATGAKAGKGGQRRAL